ncbi:MAG TPA: GNAT family N-acetyltransferase [Gemmatimonadaceae bacterium]|nr:GNAT family N-acetyltransferase [Gemmatimonadaceae bacterium]
MPVELRRAQPSEHDEFVAAIRPYLAELATVEGTPVRTEYEHLPLYWREPGRAAYWILMDAQRVGFALVNRQVHLPASDWSLAEFYVEPEWRGKGVATQAVCDLLKGHEGTWEVPVLSGHEEAVHFWNHALSVCAPGRVATVPSGTLGGWSGTLFVVRPPEAEGGAGS